MSTIPNLVQASTSSVGPVIELVLVYGIVRSQIARAIAGYLVALFGGLLLLAFGASRLRALEHVSETLRAVVGMITAVPSLHHAGSGDERERPQDD